MPKINVQKYSMKIEGDKVVLDGQPTVYRYEVVLDKRNQSL